MTDDETAAVIRRETPKGTLTCVRPAGEDCGECGARVQGLGWKKAIATWNRRYRPCPTGLVCPPTCPSCRRAEMFPRTVRRDGMDVDVWECPRCHAGMGRRWR